ncbi:MAG TPA: shikimate dehydrogenase [Syntrophomonas sp.]|jgi:shikimate dehydrogenase|nr:shikimate dehydrogenase [Syntrophomonas sp.]
MDINTQTRCLGIIGNPLQHSLSPLLHNRTLRHLGLNYVYLPFEIDANQLKEAVNSIRSLGMAGINVTIPFKEAVIPYLDELSPESRACSSVNVIVNQSGRLVGHNTDGAGFMQALQEHPPKKTESALLIGCGGAARAVAYQLAAGGFKRLILLDIDFKRAQSLALFINRQSDGLAVAIEMSQKAFEQNANRTDLIVNCTPIGMFPDITNSPVTNLDAVEPGTVICDIIYNPRVTMLLNMAKTAGLPTVDGLSMFVNQAALSLELWLGVKAPLEFMRGVAENGLR